MSDHQRKKGQPESKHRKKKKRISDDFSHTFVNRKWREKERNIKNKIGRYQLKGETLCTPTKLEMELL